ncbi:phosphatase PAP2 family protein [Streptomyces tailanensis]|uniref:phosphatase PAP2 family protein n=1 Tax=Streptomyces tailanensis TaxID=2569858 RepID=UPI00122E85FA|nr:phosphatase PAP2 family protein [Streptomyces tailanensis]
MGIMARPLRRAGFFPGVRGGRTATFFALTAGVYVAVFLAVLTRSPLLEFDWRVAMWRPYKQWPQPAEFLDVLVVAGQRGPTAAVALAWLGWRFWRSRNPRPLLVFLTALLLLNASVGAVKLGTGRLGPGRAHAIGSDELFRGGDMFPSGHTANSVVVWGALAYLATRHRRAAGALAALAALVVGLTTVYLGYHWFSDALGGWAAGALVLLALPRCEPFVERVIVWGGGLRERLWADPVPWPVPAVAVADGAPRPRGRGGRRGPMVMPCPAGLAARSPSPRVLVPRQVSPVAVTVVFQSRVWNERGPPRVPGMSQISSYVPCVSEAPG